MLLVLALAGIAIRKTYYAIPLAELKRRAKQHDPVAGKLYRAVAYGSSLRSLLWLYIGFVSAGSIILFARVLPVWASLLIVGPLLWIAFSLLPASRPSKVSLQLTVLMTPLISWLLNYLHAVLQPGAKAVETRVLPTKHTGLFERDDLLRLIEQQQAQNDNRLTDEELEILKRALTFSEHTVADILLPRQQVKTVVASDVAGPILIDELHKSGQQRIPVRDTAKGPFVGVLLVSRLTLKTTGQVRDIMEPTVYYLHEEDSLREALHAFFITNQPLFIVVNTAEAFVGVITIEAIIQQLLGHVPGNDFDQYADPAAVAARHHHPAEPEKLDLETEVEILDES